MTRTNALSSVQSKQASFKLQVHYLGTKNAPHGIEIFIDLAS